MSLNNVNIKQQQQSGGKGGFFGKTLGGIAGAVIGAYAGGPAGAVQGYGVGSSVGGSIGGAIDPGEVKSQGGVSTLQNASKQNPYIDLDKLHETRDMIASAPELSAPDAMKYTDLVTKAIEAKKKMLGIAEG